MKLRYRKWQLIRAAIVGALTAWSLIAFALAIQSLWHDGFSSEGWLRARNIIVLLGLFGIPVALVAGFLVGVPVMTFAMHRQRHRYRDSFAFGAFVGMVVGLLLLGIQLLQGLGDYLDDRTMGSYGGGQGYLWVNGIPTALGWWNELRTLIYLSCIGAASGFVSRWWIGSPQDFD